MPFAKISEKRLAKTISIAVSGFCLLSLSYYFMCHVTDIYLMHCIMISTIAVQYMVTINPHIHSVRVSDNINDGTLHNSQQAQVLQVIVSLVLLV